MNNRPLLLIVDDEPAILHTLKESLEDEQFFVETLSDGHKTLDCIGALVPDLVLLDIFMPQCDGLDLLAKIKQEYPSQKVIMISGFGTIQIATEAIKKGAIDFIEKPLNLDEILSKISFTKPSAHKQEKPKTVSADFLSLGIVGASALFRELMQHAAIIAPLNLPMLLYGPAGSGKELIARYIHQKSAYAHQEFTVVDCALESLADDIFEKIGTLFLKNIDQLSLECQQRVLDYISENKNNIRLIAACPSDLFKHVQAGHFNKSLFYRLNTTPVEVPSINKRRYDIPLLVSHFIMKANQAHQKAVVCSMPAIRLLRNHKWAGDVAELESFIEILIALASDQKAMIDVQDICKLLPEKNTAFIDEQLYSRFDSLEQATEIFQQRYLSHLLKTYQYNIEQLAEFLQVPLVQLRDKMLKLHIN